VQSELPGQQIWATTVPVPGWPGFGAYPAFVWTITMWKVSPEMVERDRPMELETITAMSAGSGPAGGPELLPGLVDQLVPQVTDVGVLAKPLNAGGASPPLRLFSFHH
jgi:hypothetical protein